MPVGYCALRELTKYGEPRTKLLDLRAVPGKMGREDVLIVFETVHQVLQQLQKRKHLDISIENIHVPYQPVGQDRKASGFPFWNLIEEIRKATP